LTFAIALREDRSLRKKRKPKVTEFRLQKQTDLFSAPYTVQLYKYDNDTLRYKGAFEFESWSIQLKINGVLEKMA